jgi:fibronectin type 3 domain-containing protein
VLRGVRALAAAPAILACALALPAAAQAMPSDIPDPSWAPNGRVSAIVQVGNTVVLGGSFTEVHDGGGYGPNLLARSNIVALDATTGAPLTTWAPTFNGTISAMAASADGKRIFVGGNFTNVSGTARGRIVALNVATGAVDKTWKPPSVAAEVRGIAVAGNKVYAGGFFTLVGGISRNRLAAFDATTGALDTTWAPSTNAVVRTVAASADGTKIFAGGDFTTVSGQARLNAVAVNAGDGSVVPDWHPDPNYPVLALAVNDSTVFAAGGGNANDVAAWDASTGATRWIRHSDGDFQAIAVSGSIVYTGGHFNNFEGELRRKLVALDAATGNLRKAWRPVFQTDTVQWGGVWALSAYGGTTLAVGGDFLTVSGEQQEKYAQFSGTIDGTTGDVTSPTTPSNLTATALGGSTVPLEWSASTDDDAVASYDVFRDNAKIATTETSTFSDSGAQPNTSYSYHVVATDFAGHTSDASAAATVTTAGPDEVHVFTPTDDATIDSTLPDKNAGTSTKLSVDKDPMKGFLMKFGLSGLAGRRIISATLRLNCTNASTNGGQFRPVADNSWSEKTVTWNTAPAADPVLTGALDDVLVGNTYNVDITPLVKGDGTISLRTSSPSTDGADYTSKESTTPPQLIVRLADPAAALPPQPLFSDGFESGDLTRWADQTGLVTRQINPFSGAWNARATSTGQATYAYKDLRALEPEVYAKLRFKQVAQSPDAGVVLKLRTGTTASLMRLFVSGTGRLGVRNDISGKSVTDTTALAAGTWHTAEARVVVADAASRIEVWLDGRPLDALTITDSLGTAPIARVQLGDDATGKSYDLAFDEFTLDTKRVPDTTAPTAPSGVTAAAPFPYAGKVDLAWQPAHDDFDVTSYRIYRDGAVLTTVPGSASRYADTTAAPQTSYSYTVRALDAAGNVSPASDPVSITTPAFDTSSPDTPTGVSATAVSFDRVDIGWTASGDDVGVAGYRIYRDGTLLDTVGGTATSYRDRTVAPSTAYSYTVQAIDGSGNLSGQSDAATATTPGAAVFMDGFESGDLSQWTSAIGVAAQQSDPFAGAWAARAASTGQPAWGYKQLSADQRELYYSLRLKVIDRGTSAVSLMKVRTRTGASLVRLYIGTTGKLALRNDLTDVATTSSTAISAGRWYALRLHVSVNGTTSKVEVWLDGTKITAFSETQSLGTNPVGRVQLGDDQAGKTYDLLFDDVLVEAPPSNTALPTVTGTARDGETVTADPGTWSAIGSVQYAYQWRRCDAAGASCADIPGATQKTYVLGPGDVGTTVRVSVTATNSVGSSTASSAASPVVDAVPPANTAPPTVSGMAIEGEPLTADAGAWSGTAPLQYAYQWRRCDVSGGSCADIDGATNATYVLVAEDVGATVRVAVTASNSAGSSSAVSDATGAVAGPPG